MNQPLKRKLLAILSSSFYLITVVALCVASSILMKETYFSYIFVSGSSMNPTLTGGSGGEAVAPHIDAVTHEYVPGDLVNFGTVDPSKKAKKNIKRYDIVTTYYPSKPGQSDEDYDSNGKLKANAAYKIKRVIALPGETFKIESGILKIKYEDGYKEIERKHLIDDGGNPSVKDVSERTLGENEYWVLGDHRNASKDCVTINRPVTFDNITGVLVTIEGTAEYFVHYVCRECNHEVNDKDYLLGNITVCPECGGSIKKGDSDIRNRNYTYPRIV